ncbi:TylF/MycF family methyltransferase [Nocardioidaceae bacterium]|nr:TylF/MycF family methyltransferase [Nocardioidaceae bacterium]
MWRDVVQSTLGKFGYEIRRAGGGGAEQAPPGAAGAAGAAKPGKQAGKQAGKKGGKPARGGADAPLPRGVDERDRDILLRARPRTMTSWPKLQALVLAVRYVHEHRIPGDIVECGVWRGGSMQAAALTLLQLGEHRHLHLFDTFEGMPPPGEHDVRHDGTHAQGLLDAADRDAAVWAVADLADVKEAMAEIEWPASHVSYHEGRVEDTIPARAPEQIAILRLDTDWYSSTRHELTHLYDRLVPGGVLIIDDYGHWEGSRRATEEFLAETGAQLLLVPISTGRIAVKPVGASGPGSPGVADAG